MIKIDLITGFLGAGKTTLIRKYASWLLSRGQHIGILENDLGAVNVDMMLLQDLEGAQCELEMLAGGCDEETHRRRFRTKLIAMGMSGYDRVLVEPSGVYDVDEFFDVLREEPLDRWYERGNVIAVVDAELEQELSKEAEYLLASETASAGCVVLSRVGKNPEAAAEAMLTRLNEILEHAQCDRRLDRTDILSRDWESLQEQDFERLAACGSVAASLPKRDLRPGGAFDSLFFMHLRQGREELQAAIQEIFQDPACGRVFRVKGFLREGEGWIQLNATRQEISTAPIDRGQEILIVIGEGLVREAIGAHLLLP